jgi:hypothetical protein
MENSQGIKDLFNSLVALKKEEIDLQYDAKTLEYDIRYEYAQDLGYFKKDGTTVDIGKIKAPLLKTAIKIQKELEDNKLEEKCDEQNSYITDINNSRLNSDKIDSLLSKEDSIKDLKSDYRESKNEVVGMLDADEVKAVEELVKLVTKEYKSEKDDEWKESMGMEVKPSKDDSTVQDLILEISKVLNIKL